MQQPPNSHDHRCSTPTVNAAAANAAAAARGAGMPVILVTFGYSRVPAAELGADAVIGSFDELPPALLALS